MLRTLSFINRSEERELLEQMQHALHSIESCPEVEFSTEDLLQDPLISMLVKGQQERLAPPPPSTSTSASLLLDLETSRLLLRLHPDRSVRRQVYELAVLTRGKIAITGLEHLSDVRRCEHWSKTHELPCRTRNAPVAL